MTAFRRSRHGAALFVGALLFGAVDACSSAELPGAASFATDGGGYPSGDASRTDGGAASDDGGGRTGDAAAPDGGGAPPFCQGLAVDGGTRVVTLDSTGLSRFDGVTPILKSVAWTDTSGSVFVADRTDRFSDFADTTEVGTAIAAPGVRAALDHNGLVLVLAVGTSFAEYTRTGRAAPWTGPTPGPFTAVNSWLGQVGGTVSEPVFGGSGNSFFFLRTPSSGAPELYESSWDGGAMAWATPSAHAEPELASSDTNHRVRPTGAGYDDRTLFVYDETRGVERTATRAKSTGTFAAFDDLGPYPDAVPNITCSFLYYRGVDGNGPGLFTTGDGF